MWKNTTTKSRKNHQPSLNQILLPKKVSKLSCQVRHPNSTWPHQPARGVGPTGQWGGWWLVSGEWDQRLQQVYYTVHKKKNQNQNKIKTSPFFSPPFRLPSSPRGFCPQTSGSPAPRGFPSPPIRRWIRRREPLSRRRRRRPAPGSASAPRWWEPDCLSCSFVSILVFFFSLIGAVLWGVGFGRGCAARGGERLGIPERARDAGLGFGDGMWEGSVDSAVVGRCGSGFWGGWWLLGRVTVLLGCGGNRWKWVGNHRQVVDLLVWNFIAVSGATRG